MKHYIDQLYEDVKNMPWITREGERLTVGEMSDAHQRNAIAMLERRIAQGGAPGYPLWRDEMYLAALKMDQDRRNTERLFEKARKEHLESVGDWGRE